MAVSGMVGVGTAAVAVSGMVGVGTAAVAIGSGVEDGVAADVVPGATVGVGVGVAVHATAGVTEEIGSMGTAVGAEGAVPGPGHAIRTAATVTTRAKATASQPAPWLSITGSAPNRRFRD